jgi:formylglycine-generating enzyme required for sulfatase activity
MLHSVRTMVELLFLVLAAAMTSTAFAQSPLSPEAERALKSFDQFTECYGCPTMVAVPAGSFLMGSPSEEPGRFADEGPQHRVTIARPFAVGLVPVTSDQWNTCVDDHGCSGIRASGANPVSALSWDDANAYLKWLSKKTGRTYRLPTEAEYEYAARAGDPAAFPWGPEVGKNNADCNGCGSSSDNRFAAMVASFAANGFGLYDMVGDIFEWVQDCYHDSYKDAPADGAAWMSGDCSTHVLRGGDWHTDPRYVRSAARVKYGNYRSPYVGFRAARTLSADAPVPPLPPIAGAPVMPRPAQPKAGDVFRECAHCPQMVVVPTGSFMMGSPANEAGHSDQEGPQHRVTFAKPFAVGRFAVTFDEWDACVADKACHFIRPPDQGWGRGRRPVINVNWDEAKLYAAWLSQKTGKPYRLLSEAEYEYVMRAGTTTAYWTGASIAKTQANFGDYEKHGKTVPVDSFAANPWGLYQLAGNVNEWVEDCDHVNYKRAPPDGSAYVVRDYEGDCKQRVFRGGSWGSAEQGLRSAVRDWTYPDLRSEYRGFRVATGL